MGKFLGSIVKVISILTKSIWFMKLKSVMKLEPNFDIANDGSEVGHGIGAQFLYSK